jgi:peptidyl-prolyl cis-trans isomerase B (cyclophilin B)
MAWRGDPVSKKSGKARARSGKSMTSRSPAGKVSMGRKTKTRRVPVVVIIVTLIAALAIGGGIYGYYSLKSAREAAQVTYTVRIETNKGLIVMEIYGKLMPVTVANFKKLAGSGFYDGLTWHRVEDWVVQTGDPTGTGSGGSDERIKLETSPELKNVRGAAAMARSTDRNSATSQFYILRTDASWLDGDYAVFGRVIEGMDVVDQLAQGDTMTEVTIQPAEAEPR